MGTKKLNYELVQYHKFDCRKLFLKEIFDLVPIGGRETFRQEMKKILFSWYVAHMEAKQAPEAQKTFSWPPVKNLDDYWFDAECVDVEELPKVIQFAINYTCEVLRKYHLDGYEERGGSIAKVPWIRAWMRGEIASFLWPEMTEEQRGDGAVRELRHRLLDEEVQVCCAYEQLTSGNPESWYQFHVTEQAIEEERSPELDKEELVRHVSEQLKLGNIDFWSKLPAEEQANGALTTQFLPYAFSLEVSFLLPAFDPITEKKEAWLSRAKKEIKKNIETALEKHAIEMVAIQDRRLIKNRGGRRREDKSIHWLALYQVGGVGSTEIANRQTQRTDRQTVETAIKRAADIIGLPLKRGQWRGTRREQHWDF